MGMLEKQNSLEALLRYASILTEKFPERLTACFAENLQRKMNQAYNANAYRAAVGYLSNLKRLPGGETAAQELADTWRKTYPRRRSMLEALN